MGQAKRRGTLAERVAQAKKPTFYTMITKVAGNESGNNRQTELAAKMMCQAFAMAGDKIWTDTKVTKDHWGMTVTPEQYWSFVEWYRGQDADRHVVGGNKLMPFVPIRGDVKLFNMMPTHQMIDEQTDGFQIQQTMMNSMVYWLNSLSETDPDWPVLQYSVLINEDLFGTDQHRESVNQAVVVNVGPFRLVMVEKEQGTVLTIKENPDWEDYSGRNSVKQ